MANKQPLVIGGSPCAGKSTVARYIAWRAEKAVCVETDRFFDFVVDLIDPSQPESQAQNETIVTAYLKAARAYVDGGYDVCIEGVLGPRWLPAATRELGTFDYVLLHVSLPTALQRAEARAPVQPVKPEVVEIMHAKFEEHLDSHGDHVIVTDELSVEEVAHEIERRRSSGQCRI